jgi:uncharacterized Rossmann fold enzyme
MILPSTLDDFIPIVCNVGDLEILANVKAASALNLPWLQLSEESRTEEVLIVGGGPSVQAFLPTIKAKKQAGAKIFAVNGAMKMLHDIGCAVDYFVLLDARQESIAFLQNGEAGEYLIAAQCPPEAFKAVSDKKITLWHPNFKGVSDILGERECVLIGGGTTVGLQAMSISYAMGFRDIHLYGFDSSYLNGEGHAYQQNQNVGDEVEEFIVNEKKFLSTPWMARQAVEFQTAAQQIADGDATVTVHGIGLLPEIAKAMTTRLTESEKYNKMWAIPAYRDYSPGELVAAIFIEVADVKKSSHVIDFGCGTGRGAKRINELTGARMTLVDFTNNCRDENINFPLVVTDLTEPILLKADIGYCIDVMEHIAPEDVETVFKNIMDCVDSAFFQICLVPDNMGALINQQLHLSVFPYEWWLEKLSDYFLVYAQHDSIDAIFYIQKEQ